VELTPRQKLCGLILGLSFGALAVDRFVIGQPGPQAAYAEPVEDKASTPVATPAPASPKPKASVMPSLAARMDAAFGRLPVSVEVGPTRFSDAFAAPGPVESAPSTKAAEAAAEPTMPECKVTMVLNDMARVNDRLMRVGETVNGFTLVSVDQHVVVVQWGETRKEIRIVPELKRHEGKP